MKKVVLFLLSGVLLVLTIACGACVPTGNDDPELPTNYFEATYQAVERAQVEQFVEQLPQGQKNKKSATYLCMLNNSGVCMEYRSVGGFSDQQNTLKAVRQTKDLASPYVQMEYKGRDIVEDSVVNERYHYSDGTRVFDATTGEDLYGNPNPYNFVYDLVFDYWSTLPYVLAENERNVEGHGFLDDDDNLPGYICPDGTIYVGQYEYHGYETSAYRMDTSDRYYTRVQVDFAADYEFYSEQSEEWIQTYNFSGAYTYVFTKDGNLIAFDAQFSMYNEQISLTVTPFQGKIAVPQ